MTGDKVKAVCAAYRTDLVLSAEEEGYTARAQRYEGAPRTPDDEEQVRHVLWMLETINNEFIPNGRLEKAFRWLGFVQGWLWATNRRDIDNLKRDNMPPGEEFQR